MDDQPLINFEAKHYQISKINMPETGRYTQIYYWITVYNTILPEDTFPKRSKMHILTGKAARI